MKRLFIAIIILCSIHFWNLIFIPTAVFKLTDLCLILLMILSFYKVRQYDYLEFRKPIILFILGLFLNIISAYVNHRQGLFDTFWTFNVWGYYSIMVYFILHDSKVSRKDVETYIIAFAVVYSILYIIQFNIFPVRIVNSMMSVARGTVRVRIEGNGFLVLAYFLLLNRYLLRHKLINLIIAFLFLIVLVMSGFRSLLLVAILLTGLLILIMTKYSIKNYLMIFLGVAMVLGLFQLGMTSNILEGMIGTTEDQLIQEEENIRIVGINYFLKVYPQNFSYYIIGGGANGSTGAYSHYFRLLQNDMNLVWWDIGLFGFYIVVGLVALLGMLGWAFKTIFIKIPKDGIYIKLYFGFLIIVSIPTAEIFRHGVIAVQAIGLYLVDIMLIENKRNKLAPPTSDELTI